MLAVPPVLVHGGDAVAGGEDQVDEPGSGICLGQPHPVGHFRAVPGAGERVERARHLVLAEKQVEVLGVAPDAGVRLERVRPADQGSEPLLLQEAKGLAVRRTLLFCGAQTLRDDLHTGKVGTDGREGKQARAVPTRNTQAATGY